MNCVSNCLQILFLYKIVEINTKKSMEKEKKETIGVTWRVSPQTKDRLIEEFGSSSSNKVSETILNAYYNVLPSLQEKIAVLEKQVADGGSTVTGVPQSEFDAAKKRIAELEAAVSEKDETLTALSEQFKEVQMKLEEKTEALDALQNEEDDSLIPVYVTNEIVRKFLETVKEHLEEKYEREVTYYEIFVMSTLLYNVEKRCDWFYPPLKDSKIEEVTGKTIKEWKAFLSQKEK